MRDDNDTIAAISTGMTNSGIGIVRMSGENAIEIADKVYRSPSGTKKLSDAPTHTIHYGYIYDKDELVDEVMVMIMRGPASYTREDVVEIDCHGGMTVMKKLLETVVKYGARPAEPGEFTKRAFLNGRIDLSQAEAVIDVISAKNDMALSSSLAQLKGSIRDKITSLREEILGDIAFIEAAIDDPEHIETDGFADELAGHLQKWINDLEVMLKTADNGRMMKDGIRTVIVGKPNAGKSSFMNVLLGEDRSIVTEIEGTTRDTLEETMNLNGLLLDITDTAGIRPAADRIEEIGIDKAVEAAKDADLIVYIVDSSTALDSNDMDIIEMIRDKKVIVLMNKSDLEPQTFREDIKKYIDAPVVEISAKEKTGMDEFEKTVRGMFFSGEIMYNDEICITNVRHKSLIASALESLNMVMNSVEEGLPEDFFSIDLMAAYENLGYIIGEEVEEDLIDRIFGDFCLGK